MMAKGLKTKGIEELSLVKRRAHRQLSLDRISKDSYDEVTAALDNVERTITRIEEKDEDD